MMKHKHPYEIIKSRYVTEKARVMEGLQASTKNPCIRKCNTPKYVFLVEKTASKLEIARAIEAMYSEKGVKVIGVNTIQVKPKARTVRGRRGMKSAFKKAIVTLEPGNVIEEKA
jgi:large subunit ribosomal protein L23